MYNESVTAALNPEGVEQALILFEGLGWPLAGAVAVPLVGILLYGFLLGEQRKENFWLMIISGFILGLVSVLAFILYWVYF